MELEKQEAKGLKILSTISKKFLKPLTRDRQDELQNRICLFRRNDYQHETFFVNLEEA